MNATTIYARELCEAFERELAGKPTQVVVGFDGDGTLWSGDVGEDVFHYTTRRELLKEEAREALRRAADSFSVPALGSSSEIARAMFEAYRQGRYPELQICEMMTWCYAGMTPLELQQHVDAALEDTRIASRTHPEVDAVLQWARRRGVHCMIVSASPLPVVTRAASNWGFDPAEIVAAIAVIRDGKYAPELAAPVPYAQSKADLGRRHVGDRFWLASLGDNVFDWEMLHSAAFGVAVRPKPALSNRITSSSKILLLNPE